MSQMLGAWNDEKVRTAVREVVAQSANGWISASGGKWHRATTPQPTFTHIETSACGQSFRPANVTWNGEEPPTTDYYLCKRPGCC